MVALAYQIRAAIEAAKNDPKYPLDISKIDERWVTSALGIVEQHCQ